ncbi:MAG: hypothetical protein ACE5KJ_00505 [Candidatus Zixiibacteriota bacterium]
MQFKVFGFSWQVQRGLAKRLGLSYLGWWIYCKLLFLREKQKSMD